MRRDINKTIVPNIFRCEMLLQHIYSLPPFQFYSLATLILVLTEFVVVPSLPVLCLAILVTIQAIVSWLLGMITCLPILIIYSAILLATKYFLTNF